jgi:hypothetical protein
MKPISSWCPNCNKEIFDVFYSADIKEYGRANFDGDMTETNDQDVQDIAYECPECEEEILLPDLLDLDPNDENNYKED